MAKTNTWTMSQTQKDFVELVKASGDNGVTLFELKLAGKDFKTGSVNTLLTKGVLKVDGEREYACEVTFNGVKVGNVTKKSAVYKLVSND